MSQTPFNIFLKASPEETAKLEFDADRYILSVPKNMAMSDILIHLSDGQPTQVDLRLNGVWHNIYSRQVTPPKN